MESSRPKPGALVGVDVGGTFTDLISLDAQGFHVVKVPTTANPAAAVTQNLRRLRANPQDISLISHATTLATNALLTHTQLARSALITNEGFRDILEIGRQRRPDVYDLKTRRPRPLIRRRDRLTINCRIAADGSEIKPLERADSTTLASHIVKVGYDSVAICFLNSFANGIHEVEMRRALRSKGYRGHISISNEVDKEYREYERTSTTVVNAVLSPLMTGYLHSLGARLRRIKASAPIYIMNSEGGSSTLSFASSRPASIIESGPAAGVIASKRLSKQLSLGQVLTFDMGGTTAKAGAVIDGEPDIISEFEAAGRTHSGRSIRGSGYPVRGSFIDLAEVSAGGGTIAWADEGGELRVGPLSAGSDPGPACYARGGERPTVSDANVLLGRLNQQALLGGEMPLRLDLAHASLGRLSGELGQARETVAKGIIRLVNQSMASAISLVSVERARDPRDYTLIAFGGAGPGHACDLAEEMGIREVVVPAHAGLFSAYGLLAGELTRTFSEPVMREDPRLEDRFRRLESSAVKEMRKDGLKKLTLRRYFEARYKGQSHELLLEYESESAVRTSFDSRHKALYGYSSKDSLEVVNIKVRATAPRPSPGFLRSTPSSAGVPPSRRRAWLGDRFRTVEVFAREEVSAGTRGRGPCIIEEYDSTLIVNPSWSWRVEEYGTRLTR